MKKQIVCFNLLLLLFTGLSAKKIAELPLLNRPSDLVLEASRIYIADCPQVHIYDLMQDKLVYLKSFGREGMGPGEFELNPAHFNVYILPDSLFVYSRAKVAYFTRKGELIRELNSLSVARKLVPVQDYIFGRKLYMKGKIRTMGIVLFDSQLQPFKTLVEQEYVEQLNNSKITVYKSALSLVASRDKIFTATSDQFIINVYDPEGNRLHTIRMPDSELRVKITKNHKEGFRRYLKLVASNYPSIRHRLVFATCFPAIRNGGLSIDNSSTPGILYAVTWKKRDQNTLVYQFNEEGNFMNKFWLPLEDQDPVHLFPYCIRGRKLYQLIENPETETYELHFSTF